jgi:hypothetical protein
MGLFVGDAIIKQAIELAIEDLRKNPWVIEDIFSSFMENPYLKNKYGAKEVSRAKEFILNNKINYYLKLRQDNMNFPCVTISLASSSEDKSLATLADLSTCVEELDPCDIDKPIPYVVKPTTFISYEQETGKVYLSKDTPNLDCVGVGMLLIDPKTGAGFQINSVGENYIQITAGTEIEFNEIAVVPQYPFYKARRERIISQETYNIGLHVHGDPAQLTFIYGLVKYALLRYREGLFEYNNFQLSNISSSDMIKNEAFEGDNIYSRFITLSGQAEEYWIKSPQRIIETVRIRDENELNASGIKIVSNEKTISTSEEANNGLWVTIEDIEE